MAHRPKDTFSCSNSRIRVAPKVVVASIYRAAEKAHSRKPISIHSHAYAVAGRMRASLFSELPRRVLLGNRASESGHSRKLGELEGIKKGPGSFEALALSLLLSACRTRR